MFAADDFFTPYNGTPLNALWSNPQNWSTGTVAGPADNAIVNSSSGGGSVDLSLTVANLQDHNGVIDSYNAGTNQIVVTVTGATTIDDAGYFAAQGILAESGVTFQLGTLANFNNGILAGSIAQELYADGTRAPAKIEFKGAHVLENDWVLFFFADAHILDQDTGLDALRDLSLNVGFLYIAYGASISVSGNFTNAAGAGVFLGSVDGTTNSSFTAKGNFVNAKDGAVGLQSPATLTVIGSFTNSDSIEMGDPNNNGKPTQITVGGDFTMNSTGKLKMQGNATLVVNGQSTFAAGSVMDLGGQPGVNTLYSTMVQVKNGIEFRGAFLTGAGTVFADLQFTQGGSVFSPGHSPGRVTVKGSISLDTPTHTKLEIGGTTPGTGYDQIVQQNAGTGGVTLNGYLDLSLSNGFIPQNSDIFTVLTSDLPLTGSFVNVGSGHRVDAADGSGSFQVDYAGNNVVLSHFQAAPPPTIVSIPSDSVPNQYITVLGTGLLGCTGAYVTGVSTAAFSVSASEARVYVPTGATTGPVTIVTGHGNATSSSSLTILADSDQDGMSDDFEQQYFGSATAGVANADSDGDGLTNVQEFLAGTDPTNANSTLRITSIRRQGNDIVLTIPSVANKRYRVQGGPTLTPPSWADTIILPALATSGSRDVTISNGATSGNRFFRVSVVQ